VLWAAQYAIQEVVPSSDRRGDLARGLLHHNDKLVKALERLGKKHLPAQLTKLRAAIAREATAYRKAKDDVAIEAARARALADGYLEDELDDRGWPKTDAYAARARRQRLADREKQLAEDVPEDEIEVDAAGNWKDGRGGDGFEAAEDELDWQDDVDVDALDEQVD
jgi:hypothetical protein